MNSSISEFESLARKHAPVLSFHDREQYFPRTLDHIFGREDFSFGADGQSAGNVVYTNPKSVLRAGKGVSAAEFMKVNGHREVLLALHAASAKSPSKEQQRLMDVREVPAYWFAQKSGSRAWITYAYFYTYDQKRPDYIEWDGGVLAAVGDHAIDRESLTIEFEQKDGEWRPKKVYYAGHLPKQETFYLGCHPHSGCDTKLDKASRQTPTLMAWKGGKLFVDWEQASKWGDSPIAYVADGSHAMKPAAGWYHVDVGSFNVNEPAGSMSSLNLRPSIVKPLDLKSDTAVLVFSGYTIDAPGGVGHFFLSDYRSFPFVRYPIEEWVDSAGDPFDVCMDAGQYCDGKVIRLPEVKKVSGRLIAGQVSTVKIEGKRFGPDTFLTLKADASWDWDSNLGQICERFDTPTQAPDTIEFECRPYPSAVGKTLTFDIRARALPGESEGRLIDRIELEVHATPRIETSPSEPTVLDSIVVWLDQVWESAKTVFWRVVDGAGAVLASFPTAGDSRDAQPFRQVIGKLPEGRANVEARIEDRDLNSFVVSTNLNILSSAVQVNDVQPRLATAGVPRIFDVTGTNLPPGLGFSVQGCLGMAELAGGTTSLRRFSCTFPAGTAPGTYSGAVSPAGSPFGTVTYYSFQVTVAGPMQVGPVQPAATTRSINSSFDITGQNLPTSGITVVPRPAPNDNRSNCQAPNNLRSTGFGVACELFTLGDQVLEVRHNGTVLGTVTVKVNSNVTGVSWTSPSTSNSGTVKFNETVTFTVTGHNLKVDPKMGFAVQLCGVSHELGAGSDTARQFTCFSNNNAGAVPGLMAGVVKDSPNGQVLYDGWQVPVEVPVPTPTAGLAAHFPFDGSTSNLVVGSPIGGLSPATANFSPSPMGQAVVLPSSGSGYFAGAPLVPQDTSFTVAAWVQPLAINTSGVQAIAYQRTSGGGAAPGCAGNAYNFGLALLSGKWLFQVATLDGSSCRHGEIYSTVGVETGNYRHLVGVYDRAASVIRFYIDGVLVEEKPVGGSFRITPNMVTTIGNQPWASPSQPANSLLDDLKVFHRALSDAEIRALRSEGAPSVRTVFHDDFSAQQLDPSKWRSVGYADEFPSNPALIGSATVGSGLVELGYAGGISTREKFGVGGHKLVIEARMQKTGNGELPIALVDESNSANRIVISDTSYCGAGLVGVGVGVFRFTSKFPICGGSGQDYGLNLGSPAPAGVWMEYRMTIEGDLFTIERGPSLNNITQRGVARLSSTVAGRSFFLYVRTGSAGGYYGLKMDWIRVKSDSEEVGIVSPVYGRRYQVIQCGNWIQCSASAIARGAQLATVRSQAENEWILRNKTSRFAMNEHQSMWIGLRRIAGTAGWFWVSGEPVSFTNWSPGEPTLGPEDSVHMAGALGYWNDLPATGNPGYVANPSQAVIEYPR